MRNDFSAIVTAGSEKQGHCGGSRGTVRWGRWSCRDGSCYEKAYVTELSGTVDIPIDLTSESAGKLSITSFEVTYTMQTVNLDLVIPEDEILHERITPYEVVSRHVIGEAANSMVSAT